MCTYPGIPSGLLVHSLLNPYSISSASCADWLILVLSCLSQRILTQILASCYDVVWFWCRGVLSCVGLILTRLCLSQILSPPPHNTLNLILMYDMCIHIHSHTHMLTLFLFLSVCLSVSLSLSLSLSLTHTHTLQALRGSPRSCSVQPRKSWLLEKLMTE